MTYATTVTCFMLLGGGILYDVFGRRITIVLMFMIGAITSGPIPFGKGFELKILYFNILKSVFTASFVPLTLSPLINDYVVVQDRGLANGLQTFGLTFGNLLSVAILYTVTNMVSPQIAFPLLACLQVCWILVIVGFKMVIEPDQKSEREQRKENKKSACGKERGRRTSYRFFIPSKRGFLRL